jgi:hypothetical protein
MLREDYKVRIYESRVLMKIFGPKTGKVTGLDETA